MATQKPLLAPWEASALQSDRPPAAASSENNAMVSEQIFVHMLRLERRRSERSGRQFMLVLISCNEFQTGWCCALLEKVVKALSCSTRETDILGWYEDNAVLGLLMTEIGQADIVTVNAIIEKVSKTIQRAVGIEKFGKLELLFRVFPNDADKPTLSRGYLAHYPDLSGKYQPKRAYGGLLKRCLDIAGSVVALIIMSPILFLVAFFVKVTSRGPILFCQKRVGLHGKEFKFIKFRTMYSDNDPKIHEEYVAKLIAGDIEKPIGMYKLANDPRITPLGRLLRRTSLDELPQFMNVFMGEMSLVGPRPPLPYEYERYQAWHKRRVLEVKPGLTGLWQVMGRSRTTFDEMVRMDIRYAKALSFWLDIKLLLQTPGAVISGRGAC